MTITIPEPVVWIAVGAILATLFWLAVGVAANRRPKRKAGET